MGKGLGAGLVSGGFVGAVVLSMLSLYAPLPQERIDAAPKLEAETPTSQTVAPEADGVAVTPTTETDAIEPAVETPALQPETEAAIETPAPSSAGQVETIAPTEESKAVTPAGETETAAQAESAPATNIADRDTRISPQTDVAEAAVVTPEIGTRATPEAVEPATSAPKVEAIATAVVPVETQVPVSVPAESSGETLSVSDTVVPAEPVTPQVQEAAAAQVQTLEGTDTATVQPSAAPSETVVGQEQIVETSEEPDTPPRRQLPTIGNEELETVSADRPITAPVPEITNPVAGVVTGRLPTLGTPSPQPASVTEAPVDEAAPIERDALRQFAAPVEGIEDKALFSVLLIDSGADGVPRDQLARLAVPVTIALDPTAPDAAQIMADYRAAGIEVVAIANDLPVASEPSDVAVSISAYFEVLDQVVGLMDPLDGRIQGNRSLLQPVLGAIRDTGHGLITYDRGLNTAQQAARRENIPAATIFRVLDGELEEAPKIKRYLDRAAFTANQDGSVVVVGRSYDETVKAIVEWALEKKDASIAMVPVSAIMLAARNS